MLLRAGLCPRCKRPLTDGYAECDVCLAKSRERTAGLIAKRREAGQCVKCGADGYKYLCAPCREDKNARNRKRREILRRRGYCQSCAQGPAVPERTQCAKCLERHANRYREERKDPNLIAEARARSKAHRNKRIAEGKCYRCGTPKLYKKLKTCEGCTEKHRVRNKIQAAKKNSERKFENTWAQKDKKKKKKKPTPTESHS